MKNVTLEGPEGCIGTLLFTEKKEIPDRLVDYQPKTSIQAAYDTLYQKQNPLKATRLIQFKRLLNLLSLEKPIDSNTKILDVGCGKGEFIEEITRQFHCKAIGIEPSFEKNGVIYPIGLSEASAKFGEHSFDIITLFHVFEHFENPDEALIDLKRLLKPNGILLLLVPNKESLLYRVGKLFYGTPLTKWSKKLFIRIYQFEYPPPHYFYYSKQSLDFVASKHFEYKTGLHISEFHLRAFLSRLWGVKPILKPFIFFAAALYRLLARGSLKDVYIALYTVPQKN